MEFADGGDLLGKINHHKRARTHFAEEELWSYLIQLLRGLKKLHSMRILHRDIKCANVFICKDGSVKVGDLNVSKVNKKGLAYTQTGTPYYASPEVWKDQPYDSKSDIWSVGCVLYEAAALDPPFRGSSMEELYRKVIHGQYPPLPNYYSEDLHNIVRSLLQVNPSLRPSVLQLLQMPLVMRNDGQTRKLDATVQGGLLGTIELPRNISQLAARLPAPKYTSNKEPPTPSSRAEQPAKPTYFGRVDSYHSPDVQRNRMRAYGLDLVHRNPSRERHLARPITRDHVPSRVYLPHLMPRGDDLRLMAPPGHPQDNLNARIQAMNLQRPLPHEPVRARLPARAVVPKWYA